MVCKKCKTEFEGQYCPKCGTRENEKINSDLFKAFLYDNSENVIAILGNNIAQTFISTGILGNGFAILSNKRVYFKGKCLIRQGKGFYSKIEEKSVDISDITGTGFVHNKATWAKVLHIIFLVMCGLILFETPVLVISFGIGPLIGCLGNLLIWGGLSFLFKFLYNRYNYSAFEITYAGGGIAFDMHWITSEESKEFQRSINLFKDKLKTQKSENKDEGSNKADVPEQLLKYKALLDQNVITEEEFDAMKKHLLNL